MLLTERELDAAYSLDDQELDQLLHPASGDYYTFQPRRKGRL